MRNKHNPLQHEARIQAEIARIRGAKTEPKQRSKQRPKMRTAGLVICCVETDVRYDSIKEAAKLNKCSESAIRKAANGKFLLRGQRWAFVPRKQTPCQTPQPERPTP